MNLLNSHHQRNLMTLEQAIGVMMSQEIGTTLTAQIIAFIIGDYFLILILAGMIMREFLSACKWQRAGDVILASGLLFLGMQTMSGALKKLWRPHRLPMNFSLI